VKVELPKAFVTPQAGKAMRVDFERAAELWDEVQAFLSDEFARP
jgi:hypothetical protein